MHIHAEAFRQLNGDLTGAALVAMQSSSNREIEIDPKRGRMPVRNVGLP